MMFRSSIRIIAILYESVELSIFYARLFVLFFRSKLSDYRLPIGWTLTSAGSCNACLPSHCCQHGRSPRRSPPSAREPSRLERKPRPSWSISSGCGSARVADKRRGSPHNGHSSSRLFGRTTTPKVGTGAWTHELVTPPSTSTASWSCCIMIVDFWQSRCRSWVMATFNAANAAKPASTPASSTVYGSVTPVVSLTGCSCWNAAGRCNALRCNGRTRCEPLPGIHWNGKTVMLTTLWPLVVFEFVTVTSSSTSSDHKVISMTTFPFQCVIYVMLVNCDVLNCQFALFMLPSLMCGRHGKSGMTSV